MKPPLYNNIAIASISMMAVLNKSDNLVLSKIFLILPLVSNNELLSSLSRKNKKYRSIEELYSEKAHCFGNFNSRYYDSLCVTMNSLQMLNDIGYIMINKGIIEKIKVLEFQKNMGSRGQKIYGAAENIKNVLNDFPNKLYLTLRINV
jgi:hypothetical protein